MRPIDADTISKIMYRKAFEEDSDLQRWDSGCWIRYKMFEQALAETPTIEAEPVRRGKWIDCKELPSTDRNVFIAYGTDNMKSVCIGHYEHDKKLWYEDKNFFATPIYDAMYWCEIPQFPTMMKGADDETD